LADAVLACKLTPEQYNLSTAIHFTTRFKETKKKEKHYAAAERSACHSEVVLRAA
jgi:hypothetical protein